jgi:hypothetical protein
MSLHARCHAGLQRPGKPTDNAFIESLNGKFWAECLTRIIHRGAFGLRDTERRGATFGGVRDAGLGV